MINRPDANDSTNLRTGENAFTVPKFMAEYQQYLAIYGKAVHRPASPDTPAGTTLDVPALHTTSGAAADKDLEEKARKTLSSGDASAVDKLRSLDALSRAGVHEIKLQDRDRTRSYKIEKEDLGGGRSFLHLFANDDQGVKRIVLRGIGDSKGNYEHERDNDGKSVSFEGSKWSEKMADRSLLCRHTEGDTSGQRPAPRPPVDNSDRSTPLPAPRPPINKGEKLDFQPDHEKIEHQKKQGEVEQSPPMQESTARTAISRERFYAHQRDGKSCGSTSLAMMEADFKTGRPPSANELQRLEDQTGTTRAGRFPGSVEDMAHFGRNLSGLQTKAYTYRAGDIREIHDLDQELAQGHGALIRIRNPHTGNPHWIYCAGKDKSGNYIVGDPDRHNNDAFGHDRPLTQEHLWSMMRHRDGFVAGWS